MEAKICIKASVQEVNNLFIKVHFQLFEYLLRDMDFDGSRVPWPLVGFTLVILHLFWNSRGNKRHSLKGSNAVVASHSVQRKGANIAVEDNEGEEDEWEPNCLLPLILIDENESKEANYNNRDAEVRYYHSRAYASSPLGSVQ